MDFFLYKHHRTEASCRDRAFPGERHILGTMHPAGRTEGLSRWHLRAPRRITVAMSKGFKVEIEILHCSLEAVGPADLKNYTWNFLLFEGDQL